MHTVCGLLMHSSLVVTTEGLPLGIAAVKFWTRKKLIGFFQVDTLVVCTWRSDGWFELRSD